MAKVSTLFTQEWARPTFTMMVRPRAQAPRAPTQRPPGTR